MLMGQRGIVVVGAVVGWLLGACGSSRDFGDAVEPGPAGAGSDPVTTTPGLQPGMSGAAGGGAGGLVTEGNPAPDFSGPGACPDGGCPAEPACAPDGTGCDPSCPGCTIDGVCAATGEVAPGNPCLVCDPARDGAAWSANDGATCDDSAFCTVDDACVQGACAGTPRACDDGIACNGLSTCDEANATCSPPENLCGQGAICDVASDTCVTTCLGCVIEGNCIANGTEQLGNPCLVCDTARSTTEFVAAIGKSCGAGATACSAQDSCDASGLCLPNHLASGAACGDATGSACNAADSCDGAGNCLPRVANNGSPCDDGQFCTVNDQCQGGECIAAQRNCGPGQACNEASNACQCAGCQINGACLAPNTGSPANPCLVCDPAQSTTSFSPSANALCPEQGLVAYYPFNGDGQDVSGNGLDCEVDGAVLAPDRLGRPNRAYRFDGVDDDMVCGRGSPLLDITGAMTIATWFNSETSDANQPLVRKGSFAGTNTNRAYFLVVQYSGDCGATPNAIFTASPDGLSAPAGGIVCGGNAFQPNTWHHIVGVLQPGSRLAVYVDGALAGENTTDVVSGVFVSDESMELGRRINAERLQGSIDEVRIYNRALSQAEITALFAGTQ